MDEQEDTGIALHRAHLVKDKMTGICLVKSWYLLVHLLSLLPTLSLLLLLLVLVDYGNINFFFEFDYIGENKILSVGGFNEDAKPFGKSFVIDRKISFLKFKSISLPPSKILFIIYWLVVCTIVYTIHYCSLIIF